MVAGGDGDARLLHQLLGRVLQAHGADGAGGRADEGEPGLGDGLGEVRVLGQEAVAGVDRARAGRLGGGEDAVGTEVALRDRGRADGDCLVADSLWPWTRSGTGFARR